MHCAALWDITVPLNGHFEGQAATHTQTHTVFLAYALKNRLCYVMCLHKMPENDEPINYTKQKKKPSPSGIWDRAVDHTHTHTLFTQWTFVSSVKPNVTDLILNLTK